MTKITLAALLVAAAPAALLAVPVPVPVSIPAPAHTPEAVALAAMLWPTDALTRIFGDAIESLLTNSHVGQSMAADYAANPGMKEFVAGRVRDHMLVIINASIGSLREELAGVVESELTPKEITEIYTFYASPTGTRLRKMIFDAMIEHPPVPGHEAEAQEAATARFMATLTTKDYPALRAFDASSGAAKMNTLAPRMEEVSGRWGEATMRPHAEEMRAVAEAARKEFLARPKPPALDNRK